MAALERKVGQRALEIGFLRGGCLQHVEEQRKLQALTTRGSSIRPGKTNEVSDPDRAGKAVPVGSG